METGFFDIASPLFGLVDALLAGILSETARLILWGLAAGAASMGLYWLTSPQRKLEQARADSIAARKALAAYDGDFDGLAPLVGKSLSSSFRHLGLALGPALLGSLPVLFLMAWMSGDFGYRLPQADEPVHISTLEQSAPLSWSDGAAMPAGAGRVLPWPAATESLVLTDAGGATLLSLPLDHAVPVRHKRVWWNALFANPLGSLPAEAPVEAVLIELAPRQFLPFGPGWMRGWEAVFLLAVLVASLGVKFTFRIR